MKACSKNGAFERSKKKRHLSLIRQVRVTSSPLISLLARMSHRTLCSSALENLLSTKCYKDSTRPCLHMVKQVLEKLTQFKVKIHLDQQVIKEVFYHVNLNTFLLRSAESKQDIDWRSKVELKEKQHQVQQVSKLWVKITLNLPRIYRRSTSKLSVRTTKSTMSKFLIFWMPHFKRNFKLEKT